MSKKICFAAVAFVMIIAGCAAPPPKKEVAVFFPAAPELPRVQYLTSYTGLKDIEEETAFQTFVLGEKEALRLDKPYGVGIYDGKIYVCDTNVTVMVFDLKAKTYGPLKGAKGPGKLVQPLNISIEADGTKYVTDPVRGQVVVFDRNDEYLRAYGKPGNWRPVHAAPFGDRLYVADMANRVVRIFDKQSGEMVGTIGDKGEPSERLDRPNNLAFDREGYLYVSDIGRFQVVKFDRDGHFAAMFGRLGSNLGHFARPRGIAVDKEGHLYAVDAAFNNVQVFNRDAKLLLFFGEGGKEPGNFLLPAQVVIDYDNLQYFQKYVHPTFEMEYLILVVSQFGDRAVNVLAYGKEKGKKYPTEEELMKEILERRQQEFDKLKKFQGSETKEEGPQKKEPVKDGEAGKAGETPKPSDDQKGK